MSKKSLIWAATALLTSAAGHTASQPAMAQSCPYDGIYRGNSFNDRFASRAARRRARLANNFYRNRGLDSRFIGSPYYQGRFNQVPISSGSVVGRILNGF